MGTKREHERALFKAFLDLAPEFTGEQLADWHQPVDEGEFPDIKGTTLTGRKIGVEIAEWLNEDEIKAAKRKDRIEQAILGLIGDQGRNPTKHIRFVWLHPRPTLGIKPADEKEFRDQLFAYIFEVDRRWPNERFWARGHQPVGDELAAYPLVSKYLQGITFWPADGERWEQNWITFPLRGGSFDKETMLQPLRQLVVEKIGHYSATRTGFDDLSLLVVYNRAAIYNSPAETSTHSFDDAAVALKQLIGHMPNPFDQVFLYISVRPDERVLRVC